MKIRLKILAGLVLLGLLLYAVPVYAVEQFKAGDVVEVKYLGDWRPGVVVRGNQRGMVVVEYEFAGTTEQGTFLPMAVRTAFEKGAMSKARNWTDSSGKSLGRAAVLSIDDKEVTLRNSKMEEKTVSIDSLSKADQEFLAQLKKDDEAESTSSAKGKGGSRNGSDSFQTKENALPEPAPAPKPPEMEQFADLAKSGSSALSMSGSSRVPLEPDPVPKYLKIQQSGVSFPLNSDFGVEDFIGYVSLIGGKDAWALAALESSGSKSSAPTRLLWASLSRKRIEGQQLLPPSEVVLDYYPPGHRLLTCQLSEEAWKGGGAVSLRLWDVLPTEKKVKPIVCWDVHTSEHGRTVLWARLASEDIVIQKMGEHDIVAWDTAAKKVAYRVKQESFIGHTPTLSGGRKYLFIPEDYQVRVLESETGKGIMSLPAEQAVAVAISDDCRLAAVLGSNQVTIWDLTDPKTKPYRCRADMINVFDATLQWVDENRLMVADDQLERLRLFSLPEKRVIWSYQFFTGFKSFEARCRHTYEILKGHLLFGTTADSHHDALAMGLGSGGGRRPRVPIGGFSEGPGKVAVIGAVQLPGPNVEEAVAASKPESLMILKPGMSVRLEVNVGADTQRVQAVLERIIKKNGWKLDPAASIAVVAEVTNGQQQQITYVPVMMPLSSEGQTVTVTPVISRVAIRINNKDAWSSATTSGAPPTIQLKEGETAQNEVAKLQKPNLDFFESLDIPDSIYDPEKRDGLGISLITTRGLVTQDMWRKGKKK